MESERSRLRRLQGIEAAIEVVAEKGLAETRIADVASRAGVSPGLLLYYFDTKDHLLMEALTHAEESFYLRVVDELPALHGAPDKLACLIEMCIPEPHENGDASSIWKLWPEMWVRAMRLEQAGERRSALDHRWRHTIAELVREGQGSGEFDRSRDPEDFAVQFAATIDGLAIQVILEDPSVTAAKMRQVCMDIVAEQLACSVQTVRSPVPAPNPMGGMLGE